MASEDFERLRRFLEEKNVAIRAAAPLKDGVVIEMRIGGDDNPYHVLREGKKTRLREGACPKNPEISFTISPAAITRLLDFKSDDIGENGVEFFRIMTSDKPDEYIKAKLNVGFIGLTRIGVFGVLALGGKGVMLYLARHGLGSLKEIGRAISKLKGD